MRRPLAAGYGDWMTTAARDAGGWETGALTSKTAAELPAASAIQAGNLGFRSRRVYRRQGRAR